MSLEPWMIEVPPRFQPDPKLAYAQLVHRVRDVILCVVPPEATVAIASDGDEDFLGHLHRHQAMHFPRDERGGYGGPPPDAPASIAALEAAREQGAQFFVLPANSLWLREDHREFDHHLQRNYQRITSEPATCEIYALGDETLPDRRQVELEPEPRDLHPIRAIAAGDLGYRADPDGYFRWGWYGLRTVERALEAARKETVTSILDLPSGHGRVLRTLKARFPLAKLTACDIDRDGVDFCAEVLGATPVYSEEDPADVVLPDKYDLIWCGSLLTHLSAERCNAFLELFKSHLRVGGVLCFTTHGQLYAELLRNEAINSAVLEPEKLVRDYHEHGFGYQDYMFGQPNVGFSVSSPAWVCRELEQHPELKLVHLGEREWGNLHDVVTCVRMPEDEIESVVASHRDRLVRSEGADARQKLANQYRGLNEYRDLVQRVQEASRNTITPGATVLVASRGDEDLVQLGDVRGWHFPRDEKGGYTGHYPADSAEAIARLEELRAQGADYLLLPESAFWWLDHYTGFAEHVRSRYPVVAELDDTCVIFELTEGTS